MRIPLFCPLALLFATTATSHSAITLREDGFHVYPGDDIQEALQQAAANPTNKVVKVHAGEYPPHTDGQALIWFNRSHDGIRLEAVGSVTLTAANPGLVKPAETGYPAAVNHVVYFGEGVGSNTVLRGFRITGANGHRTRQSAAGMEPDISLPRNMYFYTDGGAIKVFGHSCPTIQNLEIIENYANPCAGGISIQQEWINGVPVQIENCIFRRNLAEVTGAAVDLLPGSAARILNCLFVGNASNQGIDSLEAQAGGDPPFTNSGVLTIFPGSRAQIQNCTFTGNRNAVDDQGGASSYTDCIFADDQLATGLPGAARYELDLEAGAQVSGCVFRGVLLDPRHCVSEKNNVLQAPPPRFDDNFVPAAPEYHQAGYRPVPATQLK